VRQLFPAGGAGEDMALRILAGIGRYRQGREFIGGVAEFAGVGSAYPQGFFRKHDGVHKSGVDPVILQQTMIPGLVRKS